MGNPRFLKYLLMTALLAPSAGRAALDFEDYAFPELVTSARALALGNAYISKVDDSWSAFYNPAGLGTVRGFQFHLFNAHFEASNGLFDAIGGGSVASFPGDYMDTMDPEVMREMLAENQGEVAHSRLNFFPNITVRGMTLGYMYSQQNRSIINDDTANEYEVSERRDHGPVFALNASLFGGIVKLGASAVYLTRKQLYVSFGPTEAVSIADSDYKYGRSLQVTAGTRLTIPWTFLPTFSAVLRNSTNNDFEAGDLGGLPDPIQQTVDLGFSITPQIGKTTRVHMEVNWKDVGNAYETEASRRIGTGMELDFNRRLFLRGGYRDGWGSGGLGIRTNIFIFDLSTYAVSRIQTDLPDKEDRRYVLSLSFGF